MGRRGKGRREKFSLKHPGDQGDDLHRAFITRRAKEEKEEGSNTTALSSKLI